MNVKHSNGSDEFQILTGELLGKQNARSNHYNGLGSVSLKLTQSIKDPNVGLAAASREHTDAFRMLGKGIQSSLLVGTELDHGSLLNIEIL
jgi:hypothetical protein